MKVENVVVIKRDVSYVATKMSTPLSLVHPYRKWRTSIQQLENLCNATSTVQKLNQLVPVNVDVELANKKENPIVLVFPFRSLFPHFNWHY